MERLAMELELGQEVPRDGGKNSRWMKAVELVTQYGVDSLTYLTLEKDKEYFFGLNIEGFVAYVVIDKIAVCMGNPVCAKGNTEELFHEFLTYTKMSGYRVCFCSVNEEFSNFLREQGFSVSKYGEEALLDLNDYELKGSNTSKLRQKLKRAEKAGITVLEYIPKEHRDEQLERKIMGISEEWLANKKGKLGFTLGDINLDNPLARRYFVAVDQKGDLQAILVFSPFENGQGYFLDVMRRSYHSVPGVMEKSIIDASMKMKSEGIRIISLGLAPLAGIDVEKNKKTFLERVMVFAYQNINQGYDFKALHQYKKKFAPTRWDSRYIAYESRISSVKVAYVMIKARNSEGIWKQLLAELWESRKAFVSKNK